MIWFTFVLCGALVLLSVVQLCVTYWFTRMLRAYRAPELEDADLPRCSILLSLRGADPFLGEGLRQLMRQNHPNYDLRIMVDSSEDPAMGAVQEAMAETDFDAVSVRFLKKGNRRCGLKCSALVQLAQDLPPETEIVVLADADLVSDADWLRKLTAPLHDPTVGATHGNRWFWPQDAHWGSLVRYLWNAAAVVFMSIFRIPWGGTFAIRAETLRDSLLEKWSKAVVEDAPVRDALAEAGLSLQFVPGLMMINREESTLPFSLDFIKRQLTWTKLYHSNWWAVHAQAALINLLLIASGLLIPLGLISGEFQITAIAVGSFAFLTTTLLLSLSLMEHAVRDVTRRRGQSAHDFSWATWFRLVAAIPLTQAIHTMAVLLATLRKTVKWRGVTYALRGPWDVEIIGDQPMDAAPAESNFSL